MNRRMSPMAVFVALAGLGWLLSAQPAAAQNQGYSVWAHRYDGGSSWGSSGGGGWRSRSFFVPRAPAYYDYAPAFTASAPVTRSQSYYYAPAEASPINDRVTINVTVPADAQVWFDGSATVQRGQRRQFLSPPLQPGQEYTYDVQVKWKQDGREVTRTRRITFHAGDVVNLTFPLG